MTKKVNVRTLKNKTTGAKSTSVMVTDNRDEQLQSSTTESIVADQLAQELNEESKTKGVITRMTIQRQSDTISGFIQKMFNLASQPYPSSRHTDSRYPLDEKNQRMTVARYYASVNLVVDVLPASWTAEMIRAKKWAIEQMGQRYVWRQEGEQIQIVPTVLAGGKVEEKMVILDGFEDVMVDGKMVTRPKHIDFWKRYNKISKKPKLTFSTKPFAFQFDKNKAIGVG